MTAFAFMEHVVIFILNETFWQEGSNSFAAAASNFQLGLVTSKCIVRA